MRPGWVKSGRHARDAPLRCYSSSRITGSTARLSPACAPTDLTGPSSRRAGCFPSSSPRPPRAAGPPRPCRPPPRRAATSSPGIGQSRKRDRSGGIFSIMCCAQRRDMRGQDARTDASRRAWSAPAGARARDSDASASARRPLAVARSASPGVYSSRTIAADRSPSTIACRRPSIDTSWSLPPIRTDPVAPAAASAPPSCPSIRRARSASAVAANAAIAASVAQQLVRRPARRGSPSGYSSAMNPVVSSPERKRGCCISAERKSILLPEPLDLERVERRDLRVDRLLARRRPGDQLGDHRVVEHRDLAALGDAVIDADVARRSSARAACRVGRRVVAHQPPGARQEAAIGILGIDAVLDRPAVEPHVVLREAPASRPPRRGSSARPGRAR